MANTSTAFASMIVPQLLERGNYSSWSVFMQDYLISQELWNGIIVPSVFSNDHPLCSESEWEKRNAAALHAIKISCGPESFILIKYISSANQAFDMLFEMHKSEPEIDEIIPKMNVAMATTIVPVPELLASDNYKRWSIYMKSYLVSQDLWDTISYSWASAEIDTKDWIKKDAAALHAIQISCRPKKFDEIKEITSAKTAWNTLHQKHIEKRPPPEFLDLLKSQGFQTMERTQSLLVQNAMDKGDVDAVMDFFTRNPEARTLGYWTGYTTLHDASMVGKLNIVKALVESTPAVQVIKQKDAWNLTALHSAAGFGNTEIAKYLVTKDSTLLSMEDSREEIPVVTACRLGYKELTDFLYSETPFEILLREKGKQGSKLLLGCFSSKRFDIMFDVLHRDRSSNLIDENWKDLLDGFAITPAAFISESGLTFWQQWIHKCLKVHIPSNFAVITISKEEKCFEEIPLASRTWELASILLPFLGIKQIHALKLSHIFASKSLHLIYQRLSKFQIMKNEDSDTLRKALTRAIENGIYEFLVEMVKTNADLLFTSYMIGDKTLKRNCLMDAITFRQEKIARFIIGLPRGNFFISLWDSKKNNVLHMAAKLASDSQLSRISGVALQMQREMQWFKEVESLLPQYEKDHKNMNGETPYQVLAREHKDLLKEAGDWMKGLASSYIIVGTLIITIMFAAAFTLPGGNNQIEGFPIFKNKAAFMVYIISDVISLFAAAASLIIFLGFLTSRYNMEDFHKSIPKKLMVGLATLFISLAAMMITFCSAIFLMLESRWWIIIPSMVFASIPVSLFVRLQFPLLLEIYVLTYKSPIFSKERCLASKIKALFSQKKKIE